MRLTLQLTARGQAALALAGVMLLACTATWNTYQGAREHASDRAILTLAARQRHLAHELSANGAQALPPVLRGHLAAGDANLQLLLALAAAAGDSAPELHAGLATIQQEWAAFKQTLTSTGGEGRQARYISLSQRLDALAGRHEQRLAAAVRAEAGRQAVILAGAAPLLAWAFLVVSRATVPQLEEVRPLQEGAHARAVRARFDWSAEVQTAAAATTLRPQSGPASRANSHPDLAHELRAYAADFQQMAGIAVELALDKRAAAAVPGSVRTQALTIAREVIADTRRAEGATYVSVALWQDPGGVWLAVADDGVRPPDHSMAITRARAERIGGALRVSVQPEGGTLVLARLPLCEPAEAHSAPPVRAPRRAW